MTKTVWVSKLGERMGLAVRACCGPCLLRCSGRVAANPSADNTQVLRLVRDPEEP